MGEHIIVGLLFCLVVVETYANFKNERTFKKLNATCKAQMELLKLAKIALEHKAERRNQEEAIRRTELKHDFDKNRFDLN